MNAAFSTAVAFITANGPTARALGPREERRAALLSTLRRATGMQRRTLMIARYGVRIVLGLLAVAANASAQQPALYASAVVDCSTKLGATSCNDFADCGEALGAPNAECCWNGFASLGGADGVGIPPSPAGYIVLHLGTPACDGPGNDLVIYEVGQAPAEPEPFEVLVSVDLDGPFESLGTGLGESSFDFSSAGVTTVEFVKIVDLSTSVNACTPGSDIDAVMLLHPCIPSAVESRSWGRIRAAYK